MDVIRINWQRYDIKSISWNDNHLNLCIDTTLLPIIHSLYIEENTIYYQERMEVHLLILNLAKTLPDKFLKFAVLYEYISICLEYRYLDSAEKLIEKFKEEMAVVEIGKAASSSIDLDLQFDFFIGHEISHYMYKTSPILRDESRDAIIELANLYLKPKSIMQLLCYRKTREMFSDEIFVEELSCDRNSILYFCRDIPKEKIIETIHQISQFLCMLQLRSNLEELINGSLLKGLSKHLIKLNLDVIRSCIITEAILKRYGQQLIESGIDGNFIKKMIREGYYFYNNINNKLCSIWFSDNYLFANIVNSKTDYSHHNRYENLKSEFETIIMDFANRTYS